MKARSLTCRFLMASLPIYVKYSVYIISRWESHEVIACGFSPHTSVASALRLLQISKSSMSSSGCDQSLPSRLTCCLCSFPSEAQCPKMLHCSSQERTESKTGYFVSQITLYKSLKSHWRMVLGSAPDLQNIQLFLKPAKSLNASAVNSY